MAENTAAPMSKLVVGNKTYEIVDQTARERVYIVDSGTSGIWSYRKWSDGTAECWGKTTAKTYDQTGTWGNGYYTNDGPYNFPTGLFNTVPAVTINKADSSAGLIYASISNLSTTGVSFYVSDTNSGSRTCSFTIFAIGKWK